MNQSINQWGTAMQTWTSYLLHRFVTSGREPTE